MGEAGSADLNTFHSDAGCLSAKDLVNIWLAGGKQGCGLADLWGE